MKLTVGDRMKLTVKDCDILIEAMDAWVNEKLAGTTIGGLLATMMAGNEHREEAKQIRESMTNDFEQDKKKRMEVARIIQAKVIFLKDSLHVDELTQKGGN